MLIDIDTRAVDCYSLGKGARGCLYPFAASQAVLLASIALQLAAAQLFAEIQPMDSAAQQFISSAVRQLHHSMVMPVLTMHMLVGNFFCAGLPVKTSLLAQLYRLHPPPSPIGSPAYTRPALADSS